MTYNVFGGTLSLTQSINQPYSNVTFLCSSSGLMFHLLLRLLYVTITVPFSSTPCTSPATPIHCTLDNMSSVDKTLNIVNYCAVASLGWVIKGAATKGVTPLFFLKNLATFFSCQFCGVTPDFFFAKTDDLFCSSLYRFLLLSLGCLPPRGCHPTPFLPVRPRFSTILCKFAHKIFFLRVSPPWRVSPGAVRPPRPRLVTPLLLCRDFTAGSKIKST